MAQFKLEISGDLSELAEIAAKLGGVVGPILREAASDEQAEAGKPASRGRGKKADAPAPADVFASSAATTEEPTNALGDALKASLATAVVTYDSLKDLMTELLKKKSASLAQQVIRDATGQSSLSACTVDQYPAAHAALVAALA